MERWRHLRMPLEEIKEATNDFQKVIGSGGYGLVYEGNLLIDRKYMKVAVKKLDAIHGQGFREFLTEIQLLSGRHHENLITLVGYCDEGLEKILVYEYAEHGSLDRYISCSNMHYNLTWLQRLEIVCGAARGLDYLHNHLPNHHAIIHRDIKSSNILLDDKWVAKISDFGLSKSTSSGFGRTTLISNACGTMGYVEPDYVLTGSVTKKSDVYSFGMLLFEVLCGRMCTNVDKDGQLLFHAGVIKKHYLDNKMELLIDPSLLEQMSPDVLRKYSAIAYRCLLVRKERPEMNDVKKELLEALEIQMQHEETTRLKGISLTSEDNKIDNEYWKKKLPNRYQRYIQRSDKPLNYTNKKELYLRLCEGFLCDNGQLWFSLNKSNDQICSMLSATQILEDFNEYEHLDALFQYDQSRFPEVKILGYASSYSFTCTLQLQMLSPQITHACYLVFQFQHNKQPDDNRLLTSEYGLGHCFLGKVLVHMNLSSRYTPTIKRKNDQEELEISPDGLVYDLESWVEERNDGWMEVMLTKPLDKLEDQSTLKVRLSGVGGSFRGIIVEGIEFRPHN